MSDDVDSGAVDATRDFVTAVAWGEHERVWDLLSAEGRRTVLDIAARRGMDEGLAERLAARTAAPEERSSFLVDLVNGLRTDLGGTDLDRVEYEIGSPDALGDAADTDGSGERVDVMIVEPPQPALAVLGGVALPVATASLTREGQRWRVARLVSQGRP